LAEAPGINVLLLFLKKEDSSFSEDKEAKGLLLLVRLRARV
jgi:hypothetical protein